MVEKEGHLLELCRYVVLNPVRAGMVAQARQYAWSSYRATAGEVPVPAWLTVAWILEQVGSRRPAAQRAYREFVRDGAKRVEAPWRGVVGQVYLGSEAFIRGVQRHALCREDPEIPRRQRDPVWQWADAVLQRVARSYHLRVADLVRSSRRPSEARQVALYGLRREAGQGLAAIADRMGLRYGSVSRHVQAVTGRLRRDPRFRQRAEKALDVK